VSAIEWVGNLRDELPSIPRPKYPDFEVLYADAIIGDLDIPSRSPSEHDSSRVSHAIEVSAESITTSLSLDYIEPFTDFLEDATFLQDTVFAMIEADTWIPPPLPIVPRCDG
jgi:hypothetical protein